jgi:hypothetical protein
MRAKLITAILLTSLILSMGTAFAKEKEKPTELKSTGVAVLLGLDPIPGDALFYAGKPIQGTINLLLGGGSAVMFFGGISEYYRCDKASFGCGYKKIGIVLFAIPYVSTLIWDAVGGITGVMDHNDRVRKQSFLETVHPILTVNNKGAFGGVQVTF